MNMGGFFESKLRVAVTVLLGLVVVAGLTILALKVILPQLHHTSATVSLTSQPTAQSVVANFQRAGAIPALTGFTMQPVSTSMSGLVYREQGQTYDVYVTSPDAAAYSAKKSLDFTTISSQVTALLKSDGLAVARTDLSPVTPAVTYAGDTIVCRLGGSQAGQTASYQFVCLAKDSITAEYTAIAKLLALYKKAMPGDTLNFTLANRTYAKEGNKQSALLSLTSADNHTKPRMLMFGAVDNSWEYITDINSGTVNQGKYMISNAALQALHNPKYGDFLLKQLPQ